MPSPLTTIPSTGLEANLVTQIQQGGGPKISSITYPGNDTAALPAGGQTITISGSGFTNSSVVYIDGTAVGVVSYINANTLTFVAPSKAASNYSLYVVNADGATAISVPGISFSNAPVWSTSSGSVGSPYEATAFSVSLSATGDGAVSYAMAAGNSLPTGLTLASNGYISGTVPATDPTTTYTFYVVATDSQNQDTERSFSITYNKDAVTWSSPANGAAYAWDMSVANTFTMTANSAAGKSITYTVQSGSFPANVSISGANVAGTPNSVQTNTSVVIRATAADTNRFADRTLYFVINEPAPTTIGQFYRGGYYAGQIYYENTGVQYYLIVAPKASGESQQVLGPMNNTVPVGQSRVAGPLYYDGYTATHNNNNSTWPAFQWARSLTINGYSDWYIPSIMEWDIIAYHLAPGRSSSYGDWFVPSYAGYGVSNRNPYTRVPDVYTLQNATYWGTTSVALFQTSGAQKFESSSFPSSYYWSSTKEDSVAFAASMNQGRPDGVFANTSISVRAIRRVAVS